MSIASTPRSTTHHDEFRILEVILINDNTKISLNSNTHEYLPIESLSELKDAHKKLHKLVSVSNMIEPHFFNNFDQTRWFNQLYSLMKNVYRVVELLQNGVSVLLTYSDELWDRTCQISSLAQLWLDPYYRTTGGFITLVEKEWLLFGFPFADRHATFASVDETSFSGIGGGTGISSSSSGSNSVDAPVFLQFLDAAWQTLAQFPNAFEFNAEFLSNLCCQSYAGLFGTFLLNNEKERRLARVRASTESYWNDVLENVEFFNPLYVPSDSVLIPSFDPRSLSVWSSLYLRWNESKYSVGLPNVGKQTTGQDALGVTMTTSLDQDLSETELTRRELQILQQTLKAIEAELEIQRNMMTYYDQENQTAAGAHTHYLINTIQPSSEKYAQVIQSKNILIRDETWQEKRRSQRKKKRRSVIGRTLERDSMGSGRRISMEMRLPMTGEEHVAIEGAVSDRPSYSRQRTMTDSIPFDDLVPIEEQRNRSNDRSKRRSEHIPPGWMHTVEANRHISNTS